MCAWSSPRTYTTGEVITAAILNAHVRDNLLETSPAKVTTAGDTLVATGANALKRLALGTAAQALSVNAGGTDVEWADVATQAELDAHTGAAAPHSGHETPAGAQAKVDTHAGVNTGIHGVGASTVESVAGSTAKADAVQAALAAHIIAATLDHPDGAVNDTKLGNRTADPTIATAYALTGTLTQHLSWLTKNVKALKGVAGNWYDAASATIETIWGKFHEGTGHKHTGAAGDAPSLGAKGTWSDSSTSINASGTYTKNVALGFSATKGRLFAKGSANLGHVFGVILAFNTAAANTHGMMSYYKGAGVPSGNVNNHGAGVGIVSLDSDPADKQFGLKISLDSVRINGTNLELIFKNWDSGSAQTLNADLYWEVE